MKKNGISTPQTSSNDFINAYFRELKRCLSELDSRKINQAINILIDAYMHNRKVFIMGNGGGASTASHMACDLSKGTLARIYDEEEKRFRAYSLTDNVAIMTAFGNDLSFEDIFVQQLRNLVEENDVVVTLSGSGNSKNLIKAVKYAKKCGAKTIGFLGFYTGGRLAKLVDCAIIVNSNYYGPCEDVQLILDHIVTSWLARVKQLHGGKRKIKNKGTPFHHE
jgi:D-sedoheptulose 7-phosphate isomerase